MIMWLDFTLSESGAPDSQIYTDLHMILYTVTYYMLLLDILNMKCLRSMLIKFVS